jgi:hypothetical protein
LVAPTSTSAGRASFRTEVEIDGRAMGYLNREEMRRIDAALRIVLGL